MKSKDLKIGVKTIELKGGDKIHFWYANNKGRGSNNCTIIRSRDDRAVTSAKQTGVFSKTQTSSWAGHVNFSKHIQSQLGIF